MTLTFEPTALEKQAALFQQEPTVGRYFQTFNQGDFLATAGLFSEAGQLLPPFEEPIVGRDAIHTYLKHEADGMEATPKELVVEPLAGDRKQVTVKGSVKAIVFKVNAAWLFTLNAQGKIDQVQVKLLASLQELLTLRP